MTEAVLAALAPTGLDVETVRMDGSRPSGDCDRLGVERRRSR